MFDLNGLPLDLNNRENWVGIIGSREASKEELSTAYRLAQKCVRNGKVVCSGLAIGIDTMAHSGAIEAGGKTIAIVNTVKGQDIYPKENKGLAEKIVQNGTIIHPFETVPKYKKGFSVFQQRLIERDILLAYLCPVIIIVKNDKTIVTGGSKWAMQYGKDFENKLFRYDNKGIFHQNPEIEDCRIWWIPELNIKNLGQILL